MGLRRRRRAPVVLLAFSLLLAAALLGTVGLWLLGVCLRPTFIVLARNQAEWVATAAVQEAVQSQVESGLRYEDFIHLEKDTSQRIVLVGADIVTMNRLVSSVTLAVQDRLQSMKREHFGIPLGQVLGIDLLSTFGPRLRWHLIPTGVVHVQIQQRFEEAGINQTRHYLSLQVETVVRIVIPMAGDEVRIATEIPLIDAIVVGDVPQTFLDFSQAQLVPWPAQQ